MPKQKEESRQVKWQKKKLALGLCYICGKKPIFKSRRCKEHYEYEARSRVLKYRKNTKQVEPYGSQYIKGEKDD